MEAFIHLKSRFITIPKENIDTDQIIPARFLKITEKSGLGKNLFYDWRYDENGDPRPDFILNQPGARDTQILVAGDNFGCGSSREHAPWALKSFGFRAVISTRFADIFRNNALKNGLLPVAVPPAMLDALFNLAASGAPAELEISVRDRTLTLPDGQNVMFPLDIFAQRCLLEGVDQLGYIQKQTDKIAEYERVNSPRVRTVGVGD